MARDALLHPFAHPARPEAEFLHLARAEGVHVWDVDGRRYVDAIGNLWNCAVGHGRSEIVDAVADQLRTLDCYHCFEPFGHEVSVAAAEAIRRHSVHPDGRVFLGTSGSDAVDTALKLARIVHQRAGDHDRQIVVTRDRGYHGTNLFGTSVQGLAPNRTGWGALAPHVVHLPADDVEAAATVFAEHGDRIAAVIAEPLQGAAGVFPPVDGYLPALRRLCDDAGALLVLDEVICGFGRTGSWFGAQTFDVVPDLFTFAKGVTSGYQPLGGVVVSGHIADRLADDDEFLLRTGYTYSGHPAACAAAVANIGIIERDGLVERAIAIGERIGDGLRALVADGSAEEVRGVGAIWAVDTGRDAAPLRDRLLDAGVIVRPIGTSLALCPPLTIDDDTIDAVIDAMAAVLA